MPPFCETFCPFCLRAQQSRRGRKAPSSTHQQRGDSIHVIDPASQKVVQEIKGIRPRTASISRPRSRVYVSTRTTARST